MLPSFSVLKKNLKNNVDSFKVIKIAILADSASQLVTQAIKGYGIENKVNFEIFEADYNQIDRQIFDPTSELYEFAPDFLIILKSTEHLTKHFYTLDRDRKENFAAIQIEYIDVLYQTISQKLNCYILITNFIELNDSIFAIYSNAARLNNIPFFNYSNDSISYNTKYFYNSEHLNQFGSEIFTRKLAMDIKNSSLISIH